MSDNIRFVWYGSAGKPETIGSIHVDPDGSFHGQVDDPRVKRMFEAGLFLDMGFSARADLPAKPAEESNMVAHARRELEIIGEEPDVIEGYLRVIQAFADMGHSGGSMMVAIPIVIELLSQSALGPLTDYPDDWQYHDEATWRSKRDGQAFSSDGGKTYRRLQEGYRWSETIASDPDPRTSKADPDVVPEQPVS